MRVVLAGSLLFWQSLVFSLAVGRLASRNGKLENEGFPLLYDELGPKRKTIETVAITNLV